MASNNDQKYAQEGLGPLYPTARKRELSIAAGALYAFIASLGLMFHTGAFLLTRYSVEVGIARESNPLYYIVGTPYFIFLSYTLLVIAYVIVWILPVSGKVKLGVGFALTLLTAFDFDHDLTILAGQTVPFLHSLFFFT